MRDAVARLHPEIETMIDDHRRLRWRLPSSQSAAIGISPLEASDLEFCLQLLMQHHQRGRARNLRMLLSRLLAAQPEAVIRRLEPVIEVLMEAEGLAFRPRSEEHTSELKTLKRTSKALSCLNQKKSHHNRSKYYT